MLWGKTETDWKFGKFCDLMEDEASVRVWFQIKTGRKEIVLSPRGFHIKQWSIGAVTDLKTAAVSRSIFGDRACFSQFSRSR